jgi:excinuclease ABC subunit C
LIDLEAIPHEPGCYLFKGKNGAILYVGKAKDLKKRVSSYFKVPIQDAKTQALVKLIDSVGIFSTQNEYEALVLENNLIKKHAPKYNIDLKDSRRYAYIQITDEKFPRILIARKRLSEGKYFGPFTSGRERELILEIANNKFHIRTCKKMPKKACLRFHIGHCDAPCEGLISEKEYAERIAFVTQMLKGDIGDISLQLELEMKSYSEKLEYEKAKLAKEQISSLNFLQERQAAERNKKYEEDVLNYCVSGNTVYLMLFSVRGGILSNKQEFDFDFYEGAIEDFIVQYYSSNPVPKELVVPESQGEAIASYLSMQRGGPVSILVPQKGEKKQLLDLVDKNIQLSFFRGKARVEALKEELSLPTLPEVIECFDISHLSGSLTVGSMVQFRNGEKDKKNYRKYKIREAQAGDDFGAIAEIVRRRYTRLLAEKKPLPNLIVVDGGALQLASALKELEKLSLDIPAIGIAKEFEEIYAPNSLDPLRLGKKSPALHLLQEMRDEAHRFAINYNKLLRKKKIEGD